MDSSEKEGLVEESLSSTSQQPACNSNQSNIFSLFLEPFQWLQMLSSQLNPTFIFGIVLVYGLSQGFSSSFFKVVTDYYWKDVQKVQPSVVQLYIGLYYIPWIMKPVWGLFTDVFPIKGYRRRPYFVLAGVVGGASALMVALFGNLPAALALGCLIGVAAGMAIADVTIDACIARNSIKVRSLAPDMQSLCGFCSSAGALIGYSTSGFFVHHLGAQGALILLAIPPVFITVLGFVIYEMRSTSLQSEKQKAMETLVVALRGMYQTIKFPQVWKPSLYMYLSLALSISTHEGQFYWYTDPKAGPAFSQEFVGVIYAIGAMASMVGVLIYHKTLKDIPFRNLLFFAQLLYGTSGMLDLIFILRWNLVLGIPDYFFVIMEECVSRIISRIRWIPMIVLSTRLCPLGIEGTFFALLMCIDSLGSLTSKWGGGIVLHTLHVTRTDFTNLWLVVLIRNTLRFATLGLIFLVPKADQSDALIPPDILTNNSTVTADDEGLELVSKNEIDET
ncbi:Biopterin transporter family - like 8 [Theobroma cacao]|uniref:Probable folate-biopterin transporter 6 n=1 Tax=Theobroma cacao TaxID=3641 RepID=A0AB32WYU8_THECC|nr:PREDICTED: probable folate-biopterin transporter 6 [Theobroma cacao]WRX33387.1 Biopterin transporter family - like 8 [Theobroma cacao]